MGEIIRFTTDQDKAVDALEELLQMAKRGEFKKFVFAAQCEDGNIATSWCNTDVGKRQELISHLQCDVVYSMIEANMDKLVEHV